MVALSIVSALQHYAKQLAEVDKMLEKMYEMPTCTLTTILGVNVITVVKILSEIGDIKCFGNANKLAQFAGITPLHLSSSGKGKDMAITRSVKKKVNQYYIWNVKKWYGVPTASSGKCWRKYMMKMADM